MSAVALRPEPDGARRDLFRWSVSFAVVLGLHILALGLLAAYRSLTSEVGEALPAVMIDMAIPPSAPNAAPAETPPAEEVPEAAIPDPVVDAPPDIPEIDVPPPEPEPIVTADVPPPEPLPDVPPLEETLKPPPVQARAEVSLPPPQPKPKPRPVPPRPKEKVVERKPPKPAQARRAERQVVERPPQAAAGARTTSSITSQSSGSSAASRSSWQGALVAHLRRNLRSQGGETGSASVRFTMDRGGRVLSASLVGSAGKPALDAEAVAVVRRSQPLPAPPSDVPGGPFTFTIPVRFTAR